MAFKDFSSLRQWPSSVGQESIPPSFSPFNCLASSVDGEHLVGGGSDGFVRVFHRPWVHTAGHNNSHAVDVGAVGMQERVMLTCVTSDGFSAAAGDQSGHICIWHPGWRLLLLFLD